MDSQMVKEIYTAFEKAKSIVITGHVSPDGDCLGSILGLGLTLLEVGKEVTMVVDDQVPDHLSYIPLVDLVKEKVGNESYDLFVMVDIGDRKRLGATAKYLDTATSSLCIDHHTTNEMICDVNLVDSRASSTSELIAKLLLTGPYQITKEAATALYTGIITDTNRFLYRSSRQEAMRVGAELLDLGADADLIYLYEYRTLDPKMIEFTAYVVEHAEYLHGGKVALANLRMDVLEKYSLSMADAETVVDTLKNLKGVEVACIVKDRGGKDQKVSIRSKEYYDVAAIAKHFGGGGHIMAAGCSIDATNEEAYQMIKVCLEQMKWPS